MEEDFRRAEENAIEIVLDKPDSLHYTFDYKCRAGSLRTRQLEFKSARPGLMKVLGTSDRLVNPGSTVQIELLFINKME